MIDKNGTILRNLEDQVQYLTDINQLASLGFRVRGKVDSPSQLVVDDRCVNGDVMLVGTDKPYHLWVFVSTEWVDLGEFPRRGLPGIKGERGESIVGPRGPEGKPSNIPGPAGKNGDGLGVDYITKLDLSTGSPSIAYDKTSGATLAKSGQITAAGQEYNINVTDKLPIIPGDNIDIYTNGTNNALKIGAKVPVTSVNGQKGDVRLSIPTDTSDLTNNAHFITEDYHDPSKQDTLVSGTNIKTINNQSILGPGNITISGGGGGSGTDTGFDNVREIQAADDQTTYNPDTKEYLISSGTARVFYKDNTSVDIPYVQEIGLMAGDNITFTEEFVDNANYRVKINATGGGSGGGGTNKGFDNLSELTIAASQYASPQSAAGPFYFTGSGTASWKDGSTATSIPKIDIQLGCEPGAGISFKAKGEGAGASCEIGLTDFAMLNLGEFSSFPVSGELTDEQIELIENHNYSFVKFIDSAGWHNNSRLYVYCSPVNEAPSYEGISYKSVTTEGNTYTVEISIQRTTGGAIQSKTYSITKEATSGGGGGGGGSASLYQHNIETMCDPATYVYWTGYTSDNTPINSLTPWQMKFGNDKVYGGGYVKYNGNYYPILYTQADNEGVISYYNGSSMGGDPTATYRWGGTGQWTDTVKEV